MLVIVLFLVPMITTVVRSVNSLSRLILVFTVSYRRYIAKFGHRYSLCKNELLALFAYPPS